MGSPARALPVAWRRDRVVAAITMVDSSRSWQAREREVEEDSRCGVVRLRRPPIAGAARVHTIPNTAPMVGHAAIPSTHHRGKVGELGVLHGDEFLVNADARPPRYGV